VAGDFAEYHEFAAGRGEEGAADYDAEWDWE
jgi:hypothetical protein